MFYHLRRGPLHQKSKDVKKDKATGILEKEHHALPPHLNPHFLN